MYYKFALALFLVIAAIQINAQEVTGFVKDAKNQEPLPFTNIIIKGTTKGMMSGEDGFFSLPAQLNCKITIQ